MAEREIAVFEAFTVSARKSSSLDAGNVIVGKHAAMSEPSFAIPEQAVPGPDATYYPQLDGLRAIAVMSVFIGHLVPLRFLQKIVSWGDTGVILFFCLSGFLITRILLRVQIDGTGNRWMSLRSFYVRRVLRIFPIYYLVIVLGVLVGYPPVRDQFLRLVTYSLNVPGLPPTDHLGAFSHFWSLSVEEQFYLFWPMLVLFLPRRNLPHFIVGLIGLSLGYRLAFALAGASYKLIFASLWGCLDSLGLGALLAIAWDEPSCRWARGRRFVRVGKIFGVVWALMTVGILAGGLDSEFTGYLWFAAVYFTTAAIAFTGLIAFALSGSKNWWGKFLESWLIWFAWGGSATDCTSITSSFPTSCFGWWATGMFGSRRLGTTRDGASAAAWSSPSCPGVSSKNPS